MACGRPRHCIGTLITSFFLTISNPPGLHFDFALSLNIFSYFEPLLVPSNARFNFDMQYNTFVKLSEVLVRVVDKGPDKSRLWTDTPLYTLDRKRNLNITMIAARVTVRGSRCNAIHNQLCTIKRRRRCEHGSSAIPDPGLIAGHSDGHCGRPTV